MTNNVTRLYEGAARSLSSNRAMTGCNNSERARRWRAGTCGLRNLWDPMSIMNFLQMGVHVVSDRRLLACLGQSLLTSSNGSARMRSTARQPRQIQRLTVIDHRWWLPWQSKGYADSAASCNWSCFSLFSTCCELSWLWLAVPHISQVFQFKTLEEECRMGQSSSKIWLEDREQFTSFDLSSHPQSCAKGLAVQKKEVLTWRASCRNVAFSFWLTQYDSVCIRGPAGWGLDSLMVLQRSPNKRNTRHDSKASESVLHVLHPTGMWCWELQTTSERTAACKERWQKSGKKNKMIQDVFSRVFGTSVQSLLGAWQLARGHMSLPHFELQKEERERERESFFISLWQW